MVFRINELRLVQVEVIKNPDNLTLDKPGALIAVLSEDTFSPY